MGIFRGKLSTTLRVIFLVISFVLLSYISIDIYNFVKMNKFLQQSFIQQASTEDLRNTLFLLDQTEIECNQMVTGLIQPDYIKPVSKINTIDFRLNTLLQKNELAYDTRLKINKSLIYVHKIRNILYNLKDNQFENKDLNEFRESVFLTRQLFQQINKNFSQLNVDIYTQINKKIRINSVLRYLLIILFCSLMFIFIFITQIFNSKVQKISEVILYPQDFIKNMKNYSENDEFKKMIDSYLKMYKDQNKSISEIHYLQDYLNNIIDSMPSILISVDQNYRINQWNQSARKYTGISGEKAKGFALEDIIPYFKSIKNEFNYILKSNSVYHLNKQKILDNQDNIFNLTAYPIKNIDSKGIVLRLDDTTELEKKEHQLRQAQKMDSIGTLAGGLAHDFNNILGGIVGTLSILDVKLSDPAIVLPKSEIIDSIELMTQLSQRASELVKQLLTLARKKEMAFTSFDLNHSIKRVQSICRNSFDKCIEIKVNFSFNESFILGDTSQIEQMLLNLFINAGHAMTIMKEDHEPQGGLLAVMINKYLPDTNYINSHPHAKPIEYWKLSISDTGVGIKKDIKDKIFDPFFTTKESSVGTGLGLSMAYNIINQHNGFIEVISEEKVGTTFNLFFPIHKKENSMNKKTAIEDIKHGHGHILLIDDDDVLRNITSNILTECGYTVISMSCPIEGLKAFDQENNFFDLVIVDLIMPKLSGNDVVERIKKNNPKQKIILTSGYHQDKRITRALELGVDLFIPKPYTMNNFSNAIYQTLAGE